ncbi:hypothetical protein KR032_009298 [Drosophila birchii]|nr:hypothetical protein KR032_010225 [Drosophila birchii]KAH8252071.1 hypothetical protein KR032_009298 [Drosophila birchii]
MCFSHFHRCFGLRPANCTPLSDIKTFGAPILASMRSHNVLRNVSAVACLSAASSTHFENLSTTKSTHTVSQGTSATLVNICPAVVCWETLYCWQHSHLFTNSFTSLVSRGQKYRVLILFSVFEIPRWPASVVLGQ